MYKGTVPGFATKDVILDAENQKFTGFLSFKHNSVEKKLCFLMGRLLTASSTLIDDRLGEILYRENKLSLDTFVETAGRVTHKIRFGDVLVKSGIFTPIDLWKALNLQTAEIVKTLGFYDVFDVTYEKISVQQKGENLIQFDLEEFLNKAWSEMYKIKTFSSMLEESPFLKISSNADILANSDFFKDMLSLIVKNNNYKEIIQKESKLSPIYTMRAVYYLFRRGIIKDTIGFSKKNVQENMLILIRDLIDNVNFILAELHNASKKEQINDWNLIISGVNNLLEQDLGIGVYICFDNGFIFETILNSIVNGEHVIKNNVVSLGIDSRYHILYNSLYGAILYIFFELFNRNFMSKEFLRVKDLVEGMRNPV